MKKTNILWIIAIISIFLLPNVLAACEGLQYDQCNGACKPAGNFYYDILLNGPSSDCIYYPDCALGDIFVSGTWVENYFCCSDNQVGCPPAQSSSYTGYIEVYCLNNYTCVSNCTVGLDVCEIGGQQQCVNLQTNNSNCGACGNACSSEQICQGGSCVTEYIPFCPNGIIDAGEECDDNNYNYNDACTQDCKNAFCGDGFVRTQGANPEQCDGTDFGGATCGSLTGKFSGDLSCDGTTCTIDTSGCYAQCGNGVCETSVGESDANCVADCGLYGWHTKDLGWTKNNENRLVGTTSDNAINIYSDPFELRTNSTYVLSVGVIQSNCEAYVDLNDGKCLSRTDWLEKNCFTDEKLTSSGSVEINTPVTSNHASQGFFKNVSVRIHVPPNCEATFDDISFKEISAINPYYDNQPDINLTTACCPKEYCWDGSQCVLSDPWNFSNNPNLWSSLNIDEQINKHINISLQWLAKGYRCTLNESGYADWRPAEIKYDWNFKESGYCLRETDCFVSQTFGGVSSEQKQEYINSLDNSGSSCIKTGQFINNEYEINKGNHYCMNGEWTTKTFLIANVLENLTKGKPYILFCGNRDIIYNNLRGTGNQENYVGGGCVLITKDGNKEKIITGLYSEDPALPGEQDDLLCEFYKEHIADIEGSALDDCSDIQDVLTQDYTSCQGYDVRDFILCGSYDRSTGTSGKLYTYINTKDYYYLLSNERLTELEDTWLYNLWNSILRFFQGLFGYSPSQPLGLANQTQNYEKLYILSNNTLKVSAVEEKKYDETLVKEMVYMYLNMTGQGMNDSSNKFNIEFVNRSMNGVYYTFNESSNNRVLIIKYDNPSALWPYLTGMLRDRP